MSSLNVFSRRQRAITSFHAPTRVDYPPLPQQGRLDGAVRISATRPPCCGSYLNRVGWPDTPSQRPPLTPPTFLPVQVCDHRAWRNAKLQTGPVLLSTGTEIDGISPAIQPPRNPLSTDFQLINLDWRFWTVKGATCSSDKNTC